MRMLGLLSLVAVMLILAMAAKKQLSSVREPTSAPVLVPQQVQPMMDELMQGRGKQVEQNLDTTMP